MHRSWVGADLNSAAAFFAHFYSSSRLFVYIVQVFSIALLMEHRCFSLVLFLVIIIVVYLLNFLTLSMRFVQQKERHLSFLLCSQSSFLITWLSFISSRLWRITSMNLICDDSHAIDYLLVLRWPSFSLSDFVSARPLPSKASGLFLACN